MKFPYGVSDFKKIITKGFFYCDRTHLIPKLEQGEYLLFIRPRRFGKSLLLSTLFNYYDAAKADEFDALFGHLAIGKNPTPLRNQYFVLKWDFSCIESYGNVEQIRQSMHKHVNTAIEGFLKYYQQYEIQNVRVDPDDALSSIGSLISSVRMTGRPIYLLIDEYDNFANDTLMSVQRDSQRRYEALVYEEGPLRTLFKAIKSSTSESLFDRIFITGVSPVVMSDITSGYNIAENIYLAPDFNTLCGLTHEEAEQAVRSAAEECGLEEQKALEALDMMRTYYNGYRFAPEAADAVYNPTLVIYFLKAFYSVCAPPREMLDSNLSMDAGKLEYLSHIPRGGQLLLNLTRESSRAEISTLADRFGVRAMLSDQSKDHDFMVSFLYYFGVLTLSGITSKGKLSLKIPNLVMRKLYAERICEMLLPEPQDRSDGAAAADKLCEEGEMAPLCDFVENRYFKVFHNRDYQWANELTVKTAFLTLLYNDILYIMDSETEIDRRHADLTMIIRPDMRRFTILDILIEFKFVTLKDAGMTGEKAKSLTLDELQSLPRMIREMEDGKAQVREYGKALEKRHKNLRLRKFVVASLGFERIWWMEA